ncbi:hypothetical protein [Wolbachia endosymbiont (group B) of Pammene fasciana]|uniref:hypothetical protein n=1 Tax=Wolbachia endosymbiont (group B) of Pammene fasciana TaxID=2954037 RepID=UPI0022319712|nr:hypothetical protein [Wolbachia endosymbiont (group B) of Pammene fasciana]
MLIVEKIKGKAKEVYNHGCGFVKDHPYKTAATFVAIATAISLTAAYFLSPAYATFVGTVGTKAATLVSPAITAMSAFAVAHPLVASLVVLAAVAAIIAAPMLAYKNSNKAVQIEGVKEAVLNACEKDGDKPKVNGGKLLAANDKDPLSALYEVAGIVELVQQQK